ncbi:hypothetical protein [Niallia sp. Krafla_26]|uniref:hypothetical protein n=1 Tax=Niallia sp. Krafla_26 TaxID=3064703 RepID=UPI003D165B83
MLKVSLDFQLLLIGVEVTPTPAGKTKQERTVDIKRHGGLGVTKMESNVPETEKHN